MRQKNVMVSEKMSTGQRHVFRQPAHWPLAKTGSLGAPTLSCRKSESWLAASRETYGCPADRDFPTDTAYWRSSLQILMRSNEVCHLTRSYEETSFVDKSEDARRLQSVPLGNYRSNIGTNNKPPAISFDCPKEGKTSNNSFYYCTWSISKGVCGVNVLNDGWRRVWGNLIFMYIRSITRLWRNWKHSLSSLQGLYYKHHCTLFLSYAVIILHWDSEQKTPGFQRTCAYRPTNPTFYLPFRSKRSEAETVVSLFFLNTADVGNLQSAVVISDHGATHANGDLPTSPVRAHSKFN